MNIKYPANLSTAYDWFLYISKQLSNYQVFLGHGYDNYENEAAALVVHCLDLFDAPEEALQQVPNQQQTDKLYTLLKQRIEKRMPTAYLTQSIHFANIPFYVDERVLIPRSPFGVLIQNQFDGLLNNTSINMLDLCCGCGCIGLASLYHCDFINHTTLADISNAALQVAQENTKRLNLEHKITIIQSDLFKQLPNNRFDLIVCNPSYVAEEQMKTLPKEYHFEPTLALQGKLKNSHHTDGLELVHKIINQSPLFLTKNGILLLEVGATISAFCDYYQQKLEFIELDLNTPTTNRTDITRVIQGMLLITIKSLQKYRNNYVR